VTIVDAQIPILAGRVAESGRSGAGNRGDKRQQNRDAEHLESLASSGFSAGYPTRTIPSEVLGNSPAAFHVSTRGEYGMRLMVDLAKHWGQGTVSLHAVAKREDLPEAYLEQLVAALRKAGLVNGKRGAGGGYVLAREPREITAGDVVRALEGPIEPQICTAEGEAILNCVREPDCGTRAVWLKLQDSIAKALDGMTLAELAKTTTRERVHV
jgi:Rrf2 family protein